ncbi:ClpXP protease specificity-enhancing factor [Flocculibacter collagenilyticus]|uniref:ClpXP protease specificity-enhancing factor n=1 Tax=Flocculibacter collagenilyticus TaxID=2744479 RepID=UPI0018F694B6|nr:ClpXP protease specificity-enhancing factor [Flocculibacter collagenilyticus]
MTSNRPYLLRAFYDWIVDNQLTPYIVVNAMHPAAKVPMQFVKDGQIVLNVNPAAVGNLLMNNDCVAFDARFGGKPMNVMVPINAVLAIYAKENGAGTVFPEEEEVQQEDELHFEPKLQATPKVEESDTSSESDSKATEKKSKSRSHLKVIK